jgi:hypothetical protein
MITESMMDMAGMYGSYPMTREASGTSWQPDSTPMMGAHRMIKDWSVMTHGSVTGVYDHQGGLRGDDKAFAESMGMIMGQRPLGPGTFGLRGMVSLDPLMGENGYPLIFQTGETADGQTPLIDRQHPHDLFMELAASYSVPVGNDSSVFGYAGLPGEPALGPPAFMHRFSGQISPEAPLTHHWLDSTHITFGVITLGYVWRDMKLEGSVFNGREPDQSRYNLETRPLDSHSFRVSWNPTPDWSLQLSEGWLESPELLDPDVSVKRTTASASVQGNVAERPMQTTLAWGRNRHSPGESADGWLLESSLKLEPQHTLFGRLEQVDNGELFTTGEPLSGQMCTVRKLSLGWMYDLTSDQPIKWGIGALISGYDVTADLESSYGADPVSYMVFIRTRMD